MKKLLSLLLALQLSLFVVAGNDKDLNPNEPTDEGMWLPILLSKYNFDQMKKLGLKLNQQDIYDVNKGSLKDAIVWFGGGCTGEIVSEKGLLLTNHHCGYDAIADLSKVEDNILKNGFWAKSMAEERPAKGLTVAILVKMEDVTSQILPQLAGLNEADKAKKIKELGDEIVKKAREGNHYEAFVRDMFKNNQFILFVMERFTDIRLVGTPAESIGKFGGDTDNWMWPRQTCDFSTFRIYANKDNKPAPYSADNVPYKPKKFLPISLKGIKPGDFAMIFGFPGRTNRYETSYGIDLAINEVNPSIVKMRQKRLELMMEQMQKDEAVRLQQASKYASLANYWKYFIGQTEQLKRLKVYDEKVAQEKKFQEWAAGNSEYNHLLSDWSSIYSTYKPYAKHALYLSQGIYGIQLVEFAGAFSGLEKTFTDTNARAKRDDILKSLAAREEAFYEIYNRASDVKITAAVLQYFYEDIPKDQHPAILAEIIARYGSPAGTETERLEKAFSKYAEELANTTFLNNKEKLAAFLKEPTLEKLMADPAYKLYKAFADNYNNKILKYSKEFNEKNAALGSTYIKAMMEMNKTKTFYPDANSTMRLSYGSVKSYDPKDGVSFKYYTTLTGVQEKYKAGDYEFDAPANLMEKIKNKDYGQYADPKIGDVVTCFLTDNDITGGNSGSPVINGNGELIGLAFDGNWEAMSGDIVYDTRYKRTINVDIRYVLFIMDKVGGATNIINELKLVK